MKREFWISLALFFVLITGLRWGLDYRLPYLGAIGVYLGIYFIVSLVLRPVHKVPAEEDAPGAEWPTSGPIGRLGQKGLMAAFAITGMFCLLNPWQLGQIVRQAVGNSRLRARVGDGALSSEQLAAAGTVAYTLPFAGEWFVYNGGVTPRESHSWGVITQRYAYDFVAVDAELRRHRGRGRKLDEYFCYGRDILSAAPGEVVAVRDGGRDAPWVGYGIVDFGTRHFAGNHVIVRHAEREFGFYAHLLPGSVPVQVGDQVGRGQRLGRCGHSGHSSEPHLHFHVQDGADFFNAAGVPVRFSRLTVDGALADATFLRTGQHVTPADLPGASPA